MEVNKISLALAVVGLFMILLGIMYIVFEGIHQEICDNTSDIEYYVKHCMENE